MPGVEATLRHLTGDPIRAVRVAAARGLRAELGHASPEMADLRRATALMLGQPTGRAEFGSWLLGRGEAAQALPHLQRSVEWDPWTAEFKRLLGIAHASLGQSAEALASFEAATEVSPDDPLLRFELALSYSEAGRKEAALYELRRVVEVAPNFTRAWYNLGLALRDAGQTDAALAALSKAHQLEPSSASASYAAALILMNQSEIELALGQALLARERAPEDPNVQALVQELARRAAATGALAKPDP